MLKGGQAVDYINHPAEGLADIEPPEERMSLDSILKGVGQRVAEIYRSLPNTSSSEEIRQECLNHEGKVRWGQDRQFRYLCLIPDSPAGPSVQEYRTDAQGKALELQNPEEGLMLTSGFLGAALLFHPTYQNENIYRYLGRDKANGRRTLVLAFAQIPARSRNCGNFRMGIINEWTYVQGLIWVDDASFEIIRLKTDLLNPVPALKLKAETTDIAFQEVQFKTAPQKFWLPHDVTVTLDWSGHHLRNHHEYTDFVVFDVEEKHTIGHPQ